MTVTVYTFRDAEDNEFGAFTTQNYRAALDYARGAKVKVIANTFEWSDSEVVDDFTEPGEVKALPYIYNPKHGAVELIIREEHEDEPTPVYITIVGNDGVGEVLGRQDFTDEEAARAAWPGVDWREGDKEDGARVLAVGHYAPDEEGGDALDG